MVLESILSPEKAESNSKIMFVIGLLYTSLAMLLSFIIFKSQSSLFMIFLTTMAAIPIMYKLIKTEEQKDTLDVTEKFLLKEHYKALSAMMWLFVGAAIAFAFWYIVLPSGTISIIYNSQIETLSSINPSVNYATGQVAGGFDDFTRIFFNNVKVLLFCILFSFLYGAGALFILMWNASIVGVAIGNYIRTKLAGVAALVGAPTIGHYFEYITKGLFRYSLHGVPEILGYFVGALAGGIISIAVINHDFATQKFEHILLDSADLIMLSIFILFIAALIEVYVTPLIFV